MGSLLTQPALGILGKFGGARGGFRPGQIVVVQGLSEGELYLKGVVLFHHFLPEDDTLRSVLGRDMSGLGRDPLDTDVALGITRTGQRQIGPYPAARLKALILHLDSSLAAHTAGGSSLCAELICNPVQTAFGILPVRSGGPDARPGGKGRVGLAKRFKETVEVVGDAVVIDPVDLPLVLQGVELRLGEVGNVLPHQGQGLLLGIGVVQRQTEDEFTLNGQAALECLRSSGGSQVAVNGGHSSLKVSVEFPTKYIVGQSDVEITEIFVDVHGSPFHFCQCLDEKG